MRLVVIAPVSSDSSIGRIVELFVVECLALGHTVIKISSDLQYITNKIGTVGAHYSEHEKVRAIIASADVVMYHIGNHYPFHAGCFELLDVYPGLVVLHDWILEDAMREMDEDCDSVELRRAELLLHGARFGKGVPWWKLRRESAGRIPDVTDLVCSFAIGVITHSGWRAKSVAAACRGPVAIVQLCHNKPVNEVLTKSRKSRDKQLRILTFGYVNPNKCVDQVIAAIASCKPRVRARISYRVVGAIEPRLKAELMQAAQAGCVKFSVAGRVSDLQLRQEIACADIVVALRWPVTEVASGAVIEAMVNGRATVVSDTGWYSELPDDVVIKIPPPDHVSSLAEVITAAVADPGKLRALASRAHQFGHEMFSAKRYASELLESASFIMAKYSWWQRYCEAMAIIERQCAKVTPQERESYLGDKWSIFR